MSDQSLRYYHLGVATLLVMILTSCGESSTSEVVVDLSGAKALIMPSSGTAAGLDLQAVTTQEAQGLLKKILEDGTIQPVIYEVTYEKQEGNTKVREKARTIAPVKPNRVFVGTDNQVYISFAFKGVVAGGKRCCLIRVDPKDNGSVKCFGDEEGLSIPELFCPGAGSDTGAGGYHRQLDGKGNLYFWSLDEIYKLPPNGKVSLGVTPPDLAGGGTDQPKWCFAVAKDGTMYYSGRGGSGQSYFRRKKPDGGVESLNGTPSSFVFSSNGDLFSDGCKSGVVCRGTTQGSEMVFENISVDPALQGLSLQNNLDSETAGLITATGKEECGSKEGPFFEDASGRIYIFKSDRILRIFPDKAILVSNLGINKENKPVHVQVKGNFLYYSGLDSAKKNIFRRIDLNDPKFPETDLLKGQEIEVYKFDVSSSGKIYFGGLKLPDNKYFAGTIDGTTLEMKVVAPDTKLSELVVTD